MFWSGAVILRPYLFYLPKCPPMLQIPPPFPPVPPTQTPTGLKSFRSGDLWKKTPGWVWFNHQLVINQFFAGKSPAVVFFLPRSSRPAPSSFDRFFSPGERLPLGRSCRYRTLVPVPRVDMQNNWGRVFEAVPPKEKKWTKDKIIEGLMEIWTKIEILPKDMNVVLEPA